MNKKIPHSKPTINEKDVLSVQEVISSGNLANYAQVSEFEKELASYIGQKSGVATNSGTSALSLALLSLQDLAECKGRGNEVIIPSFCCIALLNAINAAKLVPRIVDINCDDYNISLSEIGKNINENTKAVIAPHMFGDPIRNIEDLLNSDVQVIEDCALSVGASINGKKIGSFSSLSIFSFYATKMMTTGHGGMVLSGAEKITERLKDYMKYDNREEYCPSFNFRMSDFSAALGRTQLVRLEDFIQRRKEIAQRYDALIQNNRSVTLGKRSEESIFFRYIIETQDAQSFIEKMAKEGIKCAKPVFKPLHDYFNLNKRNFPNTQRAYKKCVSIPIYPSMTDKEADYVAEKINALSTFV